MSCAIRGRWATALLVWSVARQLTRALTLWEEAGFGEEELEAVPLFLSIYFCTEPGLSRLHQLLLAVHGSSSLTRDLAHNSAPGARSLSH